MRLLACSVLVIVAAVAVRDVATEERIDQDVYWKIRQEATNNSKVLATLHALTDVYRSAADRVAAAQGRG